MKQIKLILLLLLVTSFAYSQEQGNTEIESEADKLAKQLQNPIANLISVPFQANTDFGIGSADGTRFTMNIQPVIPVSISSEWNLITRVILPIISQTDVYGESGNQTGLGDAVVSGFFSPKAPTSGGLIWGVGPVLLVPTGTDNLLGTGKFGVGPTAVALKQVGTFTVGALVNHVWSVAGASDRVDVNNTFLQPFISKNFKGGYSLSLNTELTQSWDHDSTNGTINMFGAKVLKIGKQPAQIAVGPRIPYGNGNTAEWGFRAQFILMFPKG